MAIEETKSEGFEEVTTDVSGFVHQVRSKLSASNYLFPLYEALVNSLQSVEKSTGIINIQIIRAEVQLATEGNKAKDPNIIGFEITDNGTGFNSANYNSFKKAYSRHKIALGCKGIGRFVGLAAFKRIEVNSVYEEGGIFYLRSFIFSEKGIEDHKNIATEHRESKTIIKLSGIYPKYLKNTSTHDIAAHLLKHTIVYFITGDVPKINIHDSVTSDIVNLNSLFESSVSVDDDIEEINIKGQKLEVYFLKTYFKNFHKHFIHYCANNREVEDVTISSIIPAFIDERIANDDKSSYYLSVYVVGTYLNENVDDFRSKFNFPSKKLDNDLFTVITLEELNDEVGTLISSRYSDLIKFQEQKTIEATSTYIYTEGMEYKHLLQHPDLLKGIKPNCKPDELELYLHKANYDFVKKQRARVNQFLSDNGTSIENIQEYKENLQEILNNQNEIGKSNLIKYMFHRKAVLKLFERFLDIQKSGNHRYEAEIHDILFEREKTSTTLSFNNHNLWILDERLAYSEYVSSDLKIGDSKEPDIFIYDKKFIYGNPKEHIVIFELKRPGRTSYKEDEKDFGKQVRDQVINIINSGGGKNDQNRNLNITDTTPKFGFVIADMDNEQYKHHKLCGYKPTPKGSLFKYEEGVNLFIEILTFDQLKEDANLRHQAFFKHLGIDTL